jgi:hypothetical protein
MARQKGIRPGVEESTLRILSEFEPLTYLELAEIAGITPTPASNRLKQLVAIGAAHICGHIKHATSMPCPLYAIGRAPNARPPAKQSTGEKQKKHRDKMRRERPEDWKAKIRQSWINRKAREVAIPALLEVRRTQKREWSRRKFGSTPQVFKSPALLDEVAMQFGITWRFQGAQRKAA